MVSVVNHRNKNILFRRWSARFAVKRISEYDKYLGELLEETDPSHPDYEDLSKALTQVHSMIKKRDDELCEEEEQQEQEQTAMDVLKDTSPQKGINLNASTESSVSNTSSVSTPEVSHATTSIIISGNVSEDKYSAKPKGLSLRRRSAPSALLFKSLGGPKSKSSTSLWANGTFGRKDHDVVSHFKMASAESNRAFVLEGSAQFATGMQIQERYLFLFSDILLVTKQKSSTAFKLKHRVQLSDMWIASCIEEVSETTRPADRSFVFGWPTTNVVATFPSAEVKDEWLNKLSKLINEDKLKDREKHIHLKVAPRDIEPSNSCQVTINNTTQAKDVLLACLTQLNIPEHDAKDYQLWVVSGKEGTAYPLIGHETPFSIKLNQIRGLSRSGDNMTAADLDIVVNNSSSSATKCEFYLKQKKTVRKNFEDSAFPKSMKKNKKSPNIFNTLFRKRRPAQHLVFGLPLSEVCDENLDPPEAITKLMVLVYQQGPHTPGILRRGNKATLGKEIREKIDSGDKYTLETYMAPTAASVFKEFLRCIPEGLLVHDMHGEWASVKRDGPHEDKINKIKTILAKLPPAHYRMIKLTICLLQHLAKHSSQNQMGPTNLATCIAPSFYTHSANTIPQRKLKGDMKQLEMQNSVFEIQNFIVPLISFMITNHVELFGEDILTMFTKYGCEASPAVDLHEDKPESPMHPSVEEDEEEDLVGDEEDDDEIGFNDQHSKKHHRLQQRQQHMQRDSNSGTDSDSMHSVLSMQDTGMGLRHNNSSVDSLVDRDFYPHETESSPKTTKSHLSPNLSRDSGLTLSDTQLYDEEACHGDMPAKVYQRSASHTIEHDRTEGYDRSIGYHRVDGHFSGAVNPVAPPRKRAVKKGRDSSDGSDGEQNGFVQYFTRRAPFKHSISNTHPESSKKAVRPGELRPMLTHPPLGKRISSDSIGEEDEMTEEQFHEMDFQRVRATSDTSIIVKSESGSHLFLNEEALPVKYSLATPVNKSQRRFVRQSSVTESTPPVSPQSRYSQSSRDSTVSESNSRDDSVPQSPEDSQDKSLDWVPSISLPGKPWDRRLYINNFNNQYSLAYSKSASDLSASVEDAGSQTQEHFSKFKPLPPKLRPGKFHEAEEIEMKGKPHFKYLVRSGNYHMNPSFHTSLDTPEYCNFPHRKPWLPTHIDKGSPPPKVILQTLQSSSKRDSASRVNGDSKANFSNVEPLDLGIDYVRHDEYINVKSKPIIISPPAERQSNSVSATSNNAMLSKYRSSSLDLPSEDKESIVAELKRPEKPPAYLEALGRSLLLKHNKSIDSSHTKAVNDSLLICKEQKNVKSGSKSNSDAPNLMASTSKTNKATAKQQFSESSFLRYRSHDNVPSFSGLQSSEKRFSFSDVGTIPGGQHKDTVNRFDALAETFTGSPNRNVISGSSIPLSRNDSKLSDSGSTSSSSVTVSTLSKHSDSFGNPSDFSDTSSINISSPTSSENTSETSSTLSRHRSSTDFDLHNRHFSPVKSESCSKAEQDMVENRSSANVSRLRKDPRQLYMQSLQIYEQRGSTGVNEATSAVKVQLPAPVSVPFVKNLTQQPLSQSPAQASDFLASVETTPSIKLIALKESKTQSIKPTHGVQDFILHKNCSMSVEHLPQLGTYSLLSSKTQPFYTDKSGEVKSKMLLQNIRSEHHQNFLKARSYFHQSVDDQNTVSSQFTAKSISSQENKSGKWPVHSTSSSVTEDMSVESAHLPGSKPKMAPKTVKHPRDASANEYRKEFHWSVKDLKTIYDKDQLNNASNIQVGNGNSRSHKEPTSQLSSQSRPHSPPPYKDPPPFKSAQDIFSHNAPVPGSRGIENSSIVNKSDSSQDSEAVSDYTKITYV